MTSLVDLCNLALMRIGAETISAMDDPSAAASACRLLVGPARDGVLRLHSWRFAEAASSLVAVEGGVSEEVREAEWHVYALPGDCLAPRRLADGSPFRVRGPNLLTPADPATLIYTARIEDPAQFDSLFLAAVSARLAADLVMPLQADRDTHRQAEKAFAEALDAARAADARDAQSQQAAPQPQLKSTMPAGRDPDWLTVRG